MKFFDFLPYLIVCAGVTYLVRMLPMVLMRGKIKNRFILSFLHYIPYSVLTVMTVPAIFYSTSSPISAAAGFGAALVLAFMDKGLLKVAAISCGAALLAELIMNYVI
ncbi:MAG: AzlD domain-containing protein [Clostridia bacterium]|nr:AzlD domain-containing protein [Clostridia bacterium]